MHEPELFEKLSRNSRDGTQAAIAKYGHLIKWKPDHSDTILDVGCGPGNVLMDIILPQFKGLYSTCYATDISERMIDFARKKYEDREDVKFQVLDITQVSGFLQNHGHIDHVVSSFVMHYVPDLDTGLRNIFKVLEPGGDFFTVHIRDSGFFDLYEYMDQNTKWNKYFENLKKFVPSSHHSSTPEEELRIHLTRVGFTEVFVDSIPFDAIAHNEDALKLLFNSVFPQIHNIPAEMRKEYLEDVFDYGTDKKLIVKLPSGEVSISCNMLVAFGRKRK